MAFSPKNIAPSALLFISVIIGVINCWLNADDLMRAVSGSALILLFMTGAIALSFIIVVFCAILIKTGVGFGGKLFMIYFALATVATFAFIKNSDMSPLFYILRIIQWGLQAKALAVYNSQESKGGQS